MMRRTSQACSRGMTIVELLVAMVIGLFLVGATYSMFLAYKRSYTITDQVSRMAENGRFALHLVSSDVRLAGFFGEASVYNVDRGRNLGEVSNDCSGVAAAYDLDNYIVVAEADDDGAALGCIDDAVPDTGILIVKSVLPQRLAAAADENKIYVATNRLQGVLFSGDDPSPPSISGTGDVPNGDYWEYRFVAYYIRAGAVPSLARKVMQFSGGQQQIVTQDIVEGVEELRAMAAVDGDGDGRVDRVLAPDAVDDWTDVAHLQLFLLVRSVEPEAGYEDDKTYSLGEVDFGPVGDNFKRTLLEGSVALRNRAW